MWTLECIRNNSQYCLQTSELRKKCHEFCFQKSVTLFAQSAAVFFFGAKPEKKTKTRKSAVSAITQRRGRVVLLDDGGDGLLLVTGGRQHAVIVISIIVIIAVRLRRRRRKGVAVHRRPRPAYHEPERRLCVRPTRQYTNNTVGS